MFLCLIPYHYDVEREKAVRSFTTERLLPRLHERPGFQGYLLSADRHHRGQGLLLTLWETPLQAEIAVDTLAELEPALRSVGLKMDEAPQIQEVLGRPGLCV